MIDALAKAVLARDRRALSRAITLVESQAPAHRRQARELLAALLPQKPKAPKTLRLGISGSPGTGKSTLIEAFGAELLSRGHRLAVLAVDPSSQRSGGSIMGDKTRMPNLSAATNAYVRPSPSRGVLGGVARRTEDALLLCECGGHDRLIVETVGVGQSETAVAGLCDFFMLLVPPAAGDGLQGIKRGIMEVADLVVVTKADGDLLPAARAMAAELRPALKLLRPRDPCWTPSVVTSSALDPSSFLGSPTFATTFSSAPTNRACCSGTGARRRPTRSGSTPTPSSPTLCAPRPPPSAPSPTSPPRWAPARSRRAPRASGSPRRRCAGLTAIRDVPA